MINKIKSLFTQTNAKVAAVALTLGGLLASTAAHAAVDPDVASTTQTLVSTMKENVTGAITANIANIVIVGVIIFSLTFIWRLSKRFMR